MLGLMPMAVSTGMGSETQKPFAAAWSPPCSWPCSSPR
ncbi:hypothetical protein [Nannocystis exedens]